MAQHFPTPILLSAVLFAVCLILLQSRPSLATPQKQKSSPQEDELDLKKHLRSDHTKHIKASHHADAEVPQAVQDRLLHRNLSIGDRWNNFKDVNKKNFSHPKEHDLRFDLFNKRALQVDMHNVDHENGLHSFEQELNEYADWSVDELEDLRGTTPHVRPSEAAHDFGNRRKRQSLPASVDWRSQGAVGPVKDQMKCGSCYSFSSTGALESHRALKYGNLVPLNVQQTLDCSYSYKNKGCDGGHPYYVYSYLRDLTQQRSFLARDNCYPYTSGISLATGTCHVPKTNLSCAGIQVKGFSWLDNEDDMQYALANIGPVVVLMDVSQSSFQYYKSGVYSDTKCSSTTYNHAMLAIGYGTENGKKLLAYSEQLGDGLGRRRICEGRAW